MPKKNIIPDYVTFQRSSVHLVCIDRVTKLISEYSPVPVAVTSANLSGAPLITDPTTVIEKFENSVDLFLIAGESKYKCSTTIVDFTQEPPTILRKGFQEILKQLSPILNDR